MGDHAVSIDGHERVGFNRRACFFSVGLGCGFVFFFVLSAPLEGAGPGIRKKPSILLCNMKARFSRGGTEKRKN